MKKLKLFFISAMATFSLNAGAVLAPVAVLAAPQDAICAGIGSASDGSGDCAENPDDTNVSSVLGTVITLLSVILGIVAVIMVIVGGFKYVTSGGDSGKTASAKNTIIYALIGIFVAALAQVLVHFVINRTTTNSAAQQQQSGAPANAE